MIGISKTIVSPEGAYRKKTGNVPIPALQVLEEVLQDTEKSCEILSSGNDTAITNVTCVDITCSDAAGKTVNNQSYMGRSLVTPAVPAELVATIRFGEVYSFCLQLCAHW